MPKVTADHDVCEGYGNCVTGAPDVYDIDDDGTVVLRKDVIDEEDRARVETAALSCPVSALTVSD
ncbi:ferredoxin [Actinophytocola sp.]|jgi:ferredoxin|uniref:ferredoxin n=1 Tax=Actinophytocola sp. TaxID=1872138 RepID=UPI002ED987DD